MSETKKILYLIPSFESGGAERQLLYLIDKIAPDNFDIQVVYFHPDRFYDLPEEKAKFEELPRPSKNPLAFIRQFCRVARNFRPHCIHSFLPHGNLIAAFLGKALRIPVIASVRSPKIPQMSSFLDGIVFGWSVRITVNSDLGRKRLIASGVEREKLSLIYNGVDVNRLAKLRISREEACAKLGIRPNGIICTMVGRISPEKNHLCILRAIKQLRDNSALDKYLSLYMYGRAFNEDYLHEVKNYIAEHKLDGICRIFQPVNNITDVYSASDFLVFPSTWEGCPNVLLEAMASSVPIIASDIDVNLNFIQDGINGMLFKSDDHKDLAGYLAQMCRLSPEKRSLMGSEGKDIVSKYSIERMVKNTLQQYEMVFSANAL